ncbi:branched-chain amino acid ABC transporter permease [Variovorax ginsengisoli]|uniref:Branched-chain amino acid transport system permease protein n=1 Tax=Variovorax ginsengisoli TaxID=363844 RepID=A0ABT9S9E5_9BURK|nr:branched-chain amino acid ABC transporter permease [Variovorax ginsengisoli]MDP9900983.1 branched-chain amino acid transport system permease protein [Variovorax ginsengisoli]
MGYLSELVISGLVIGAIYGLIAMAFSVIYKATGLVNFAQGEVGMLIAYLSWSFSTTFGTGALGVVAMAVVGGIAVGLLIERIVMRPMLGEPVFSAVLVTIGLAVVLRSFVILVWGASPQKLDVGAADAVLRFGGIGMRSSQLGVVAVLLLCVLGVWLFFQRSRFGIAMRAVAADEKTARLMGVSTAQVQAVAWAASSVFAGLAGVFFAVIYNLSPELFALGLKAFPATVLGGLDAVIGSGISGLVIGVAENLVGGYVSSTLKEVAGFLLILVVLMVRPFGLFGEREIERV